ncbi:MAG: pectinesterase family protein [Candidatus Bathyarchaeota archaeon]|nr:pectinesterase family protein [Candidatus Bathyarchaeota archaeon]
MNLKTAALAVALIGVLLISAFTVVDYYLPRTEAEESPFYVGIEFGYGDASQCEALIDKVKNYTNLLVISNPAITLDETLLNATCDYAYNAGMHLIIYFTDNGEFTSYTGDTNYNHLWTLKAKEKYGAYFLGSYVYDEPAGRVLDKDPGCINIDVNLSNPTSYSTARDYLGASNNYAANVYHKISAYQYCAQMAGTSVLTADYALYWFNYKAGYDTVLAEFGWGNDRQMVISLCRGAATAQGKDWGAIICWQVHTTETAGWLESGPALYSDLVLAYNNGAKYAVVFDYAGDGQANPYEFGILTDEHFEALQNFWDYIQQNPEKHGSVKADTALVLPEGYGMGFRGVTDKIWGFDEADVWTLQIYNDTIRLLNEYGSRLDIVYSDPEFQEAIVDRYANVISWTSGAAEKGYPVINLNNTFGYFTIQEAINSGATSNGDTLYVKAGIYRENININKQISLVGENKETTIIDGGNSGTAITITQTNVKVTEFTVTNGRFPIDSDSVDSEVIAEMQSAFLQSIGIDLSRITQYDVNYLEDIFRTFLQKIGDPLTTVTRSGIYLLNANNCSLTNNIIVNCTYGVVIDASTNVTMRNNNLTGNEYSFGVSASGASHYAHDIDCSNSVNGKPIYYWVGKSGSVVPSDAGYVALVNCTNITVDNLQLSGNYNGLVLANTQQSTIKDNTLTENYEGLRMVYSSSNVFKNNKMADNIFNLNADSYANDFDSSNKLDGKPVYMWINQHDRTVPTDAGYVALINCTGITVKNLNLSSGLGVGILLKNTNNSVVTQNTLTNQNCGIKLLSSSGNTVTQNNVSDSYDGIILELSADNYIFGNDFKGNQKSSITLQSCENNKIEKIT